MPWARAPAAAPTRSTTPITTPSSAPITAMITDSQRTIARHLAAAHPDRAQQARARASARRSTGPSVFTMPNSAMMIASTSSAVTRLSSWFTNAAYCSRNAAWSWTSMFAKSFVAASIADCDLPRGRRPASALTSTKTSSCSAKFCVVGLERDRRSSPTQRRSPCRSRRPERHRRRSRRTPTGSGRPTLQPLSAAVVVEDHDRRRARAPSSAPARRSSVGDLLDRRRVERRSGTRCRRRCWNSPCRNSRHGLDARAPRASSRRRPG